MFNISNLKYDNPPLIELVIGVRFAKLDTLTLPHLGLFWHSIRDVFTRCEHAPPHGTVDDVTDPSTNLPLPRVWLINSSDDHLLQLQRNMILFNWRKRGQEYPHFDRIKPLFVKYFDMFERFVLENQIGDIQPTEYELTYLDQIPSGEGWHQLSDLGSVFPALRGLTDESRSRANARAINIQIAYSMPSNLGVLTVKISTARRQLDMKDLIVLDMTARSDMKTVQTASMDEWFNAAHENIRREFFDLCSEEIQVKQWRRRGP